MTDALKDVKLHRVDCLDDALAFKRWLGERRPILAVDTETTGIKPWKDKIRLVQFGDANEGWTLPWGDWAGLVREVVREYDGMYVLHNARFDTWMLDNEGVHLPRNHRAHDTMIMAHVLDSTQYNGLKPLSARYIDRNAGVAQEMLDKAMTNGGWDWATVPIEVPVYSVYAAMDTVLTARLFEQFYPSVRATAPKAYDLEMAFSWLVLGMEQKGTALDEAYTQKALHDFSAYIEQVDEWCRATYGISPGKNASVVAILQKEGVEFSKMTPGGATSLDKEVLEQVIAATHHPLAEVVLRRRQTQKLASTYLSNFLKFATDGVLRPSMKSVGARTGRMSISDPALQTLPRRSENNPLAITVRNCIVPREGNVLLMADFDQIEGRMGAHFAQDPGLQAAFQEEDFFTAVCREIFSDPTIQKSDPRRQTTKNAVYAEYYGAGTAQFALTAGISMTVAQDFRQQLALKYPGIKRMQKQIERVAREREEVEGRGYIISPLTQRRHYADEDKVYTLVNYLIQGTAAEVLKIKALELDAAGVGEFMTLLVHDEVIMDVPREQVRDVAAVTESVLNDDKLFTVPLTSHADLGERWGEKGAIQLDQMP